MWLLSGDKNVLSNTALTADLKTLSTFGSVPFRLRWCLRAPPESPYAFRSTKSLRLTERCFSNISTVGLIVRRSPLVFRKRSSNASSFYASPPCDRWYDVLLGFVRWCLKLLNTSDFLDFFFWGGGQLISSPGICISSFIVFRVCVVCVV